MLIRLDQVREEPFRWQETQDIAAEDLERPELLALGEVSWEGRVTYAPPAYLLEARITYEQTLACTRCLAPMTLPMSAEVNLMIEIDPHPPAAGEHEMREEDLGVLVLRDELLDLQPMLIEQLQLNVPMRVLCREECAGLCPVCGADRNRTPCDCAEPAADPRWAALATLRGRFERER